MDDVFFSPEKHGTWDMNPEILKQREQLMEDIGSIIDSFRFETYDDLYELEKNLCDAVCKNFPAN